MKLVVKAMKEVAERELRELSKHPNKVFKLVKSMKKNGKMLREKNAWEVAMVVELLEELCEEVEMVRGSCYLGVGWMQVVVVRQLWQREQELGW